MVPDLLPKKKIGELFRKYGFYPSRKLGQNFLIDGSVIKKFLKAADLKSKDIILEIGPGIGNLTQGLAKKAKKVIAVEKDPRLIRILNNELRIKKIKNVKVIEGDILQIPNSKFIIHNSYKVVANLPFNIASPVVRKFLESNNQPRVLILIVQKEVAQRICARPPDMNLLAVSVQFYAEPEIISYVSKKSFWPQPKVDSAIIKITPKRKLWVSDSNNLFFRIVRAGFSQPRKQILNNLSKVLKLEKEKVKLWLLTNNIQPEQRAERLTVKDWVNLTKGFKNIGSITSDVK